MSEEERCKSCYHYTHTDDEYDWCHMCVMEYDCYKPEPAEGERMSDNISHPSHYQGKYECIDLMREIFGDEAVRGFCICNAYKYRFRAGKKPGNSAEEDEGKAKWYENYLMQHLSVNPATHIKLRECIGLPPEEGEKE